MRVKPQPAQASTWPPKAAVRQAARRRRTAACRRTRGGQRRRLPRGRGECPPPPEEDGLVEAIMVQAFPSAGRGGQSVERTGGLLHAVRD